MKYILSTMTQTVNYRFYTYVGDLPVATKSVYIHGGATLPSDTSGIGEVTRDQNGKPLWTPSGIVTQISDEDFEQLKNHHVFKSHLEKNYLKVIDNDIRDSHRAMDKNVAQMDHDGFTQLTPKNYEKRVGIKLKSIRTTANSAEDEGRI